MALRTLISAEKINARIRELGKEIDRDYPNGTLYLICILKGATIFLSDLARSIERDAFIDFMGIASYGKGKTSSGEVKVTKDLDISLEGADGERVARALLAEAEVLPIGLGARDSLRLEAGLCLYGHEMDETVDPVEASLVWAMGKRRNRPMFLIDQLIRHPLSNGAPVVSARVAEDMEKAPP